MNTETKLQIIKSLVFGLTAEEIICHIDGVSVEDVSEISNTCSSEIAEEKAYIERMGE